MGIPLLAEPGKGFGPVRFGASVETIERLMGAPCDQRIRLPSPADDGAQEVCQYFTRAVEFRVGSEGVVGMVAHRVGRQPEGEPKRRFGFFKGRLSQGDAAPGMMAEAVRAGLGPPLRVDRWEPPGPNGTVVVEHHAGFRLEYDRVPGGSVVLGSIQLYREGASSP